MQPGYEIGKPRGRRDSSSKQGQGQQGQLPDQDQTQGGFSGDRSWRPVPLNSNSNVMGIGGDGSLRMPTSSQGSSLGIPGPRGPARTMGGFRPVPPPINVRSHRMSLSTDMYGSGIPFPQPGMTPTGPSISWTDEDVWAGMNASQPDPRMGMQQDASMSALILSPRMMPIPPLHPMTTLQSPTDSVMPISANVLAHRQTPSSAHSSNGMFGYSMDVNTERMHAATPYFGPHQTFPDAGPSSEPPLAAVSDAMMHRYGHRLSTGSIGDQLALSAQSQSLSLDDMGEMRPNWIERDDVKEEDDMLGMQDDELDEDDEDGEADGRPRKKPRNSLRRGTACVRCRSKKLKCTGERPVCSVCLNSRKPVECVYQPMAKRKPKTLRLRSRLQELEDQIKEKESQLSKLDEPLPDTPLMTRSRLGIISEEAETGPSQLVPLSEGKDPSDLLRSGESTSASGLHVLFNVSNMSSSNHGQPPATRSNATFEGFSRNTGEPIFETKRGAGLNRFAEPFDPSSNHQYAGVEGTRGSLAMDRLLDSTDLRAQGLVFGPGTVDVMPSSPVEYALIYAVLPYSLYFCMPVHPARFLDSLLPASPQRPHPALLYALFTASIYVLVNKLPPPPEAMALPLRFPRPDNSLYLLLTDFGSSFYSRAKSELDLGLQAQVQMDDVTKASAGLAKYLLLTGRVLQALMLPFVRLAMACGLHRICLPQIGTTGGDASQPSAGEGSSTNASPPMAAADVRSDSGGTAHYHYRPKLVIVPPAPDKISLWERIETFWAVKELDWGTSLLWAWSCGLADNEIQTVWPQRFETFMLPEIGRRDSRGIWDLMNAKKPLARDLSDPRVLALQSLSLVSTANSLKKLQRALEAFRTSLPDPDNLPETISSDPWWIFTRANVATADMLFYAESAVSQPAMYGHAVSAARRLVELMREIPVDLYAHLNCFVFLDVSLVARFLYREAARLKLTSTDPQSSLAALADADTLLRTLEEKVGKWHPFGLYLAEDIRRVKHGERERPELYERAL